MNKKSVILGEFEITGNEVIVSDPIYKKDIWCQGHVKNVKNGTYVGMVSRIRKEFQGTNLGEWNQELIAIHKDYVNRKIYWRQLFDVTIGADSKKVGFYDAKSFKGNDREWNVFQHRLINNINQGGVLLNGVVAQSGAGDGSYNLYVIEKDDQIVGFRVKFLH